MKYDFESIIDRHNKDALAIDGCGSNDGFSPKKPKPGFDLIPMWIADMNFKTCPSVIDEIKERLEHPIFGYFSPSCEYYNSIIEWQKNRNGVTDLAKENIGYENGVLGGLIATVSAYINKGDSVLVHSPTYIGFTNSLKAAGYNIVLSPLIKDASDKYVMDYVDMDAKIKQNNIKIAILCNPHNPTGRVWEKDELLKAIEVYKSNDCIVISDEIWSDIILNGNKHTPTQSVSEDAKNRVVALYAPSKTFNLAGLVGSYHIIYNKEISKKVLESSDMVRYNMINVLSMHSLIGAYKKEGYEWLEQLLQVLSKNVNYAYNYIKENIKDVDVCKPQGTYMLFVDCKNYCTKHNVTLDTLLERGWDVGVGYQDGRPFHGQYSIRINLALPYSRVIEAFYRISKYVFID